MRQPLHFVLGGGMFARLLIICGLASVGLALAGCGCDDPQRHEITGQVTYKGQPVAEGVIDFEPLSGQASKDGATIQYGVYRIPRDKGLFPGKYRVSIVIGDGGTTAGNAGADLPQGKVGVARGAERAPPEFNVRSTQIREVSRDGPHTFNFAIP